MASPSDPHDQFAPLNNLQQNWLESYLLETIHEQDNIEIRWGNKVIAHEQNDETVTLTIHTPEGEYQHESSWVVAADGGRSALREQMKLRMQGASYEGRFVIADIRIKLDYPTERLAFSHRTGTRAIPFSCTANQIISGVLTISLIQVSVRKKHSNRKI